MFCRARRPRIDEAFKTFVKEQRCLFCDAAPVDPHHLVSRKWREPTRDDFLCVPLCRRCHGEVDMGLETALKRHGMVMKDLVLASVDLLVEFFTRAGVHVEAAF